MTKKQMIFRKIFNFLSFLGIFLLLGVFFQYVRAWTNPTQAPPNGNLGAPINTSSNAQIKDGGFGLGLTSPGLLRVYGSASQALFDGNVGIGTASPSSKLHILTPTSGTSAKFGEFSPSVSLSGMFLERGTNQHYFYVNNSNNRGGIYSPHSINFDTGNNPYTGLAMYSQNSGETSRDMIFMFSTNIDHGLAIHGPNGRGADGVSYANTNIYTNDKHWFNRGNVGIGPKDPEAKLHIENSGSGYDFDVRMASPAPIGGWTLPFGMLITYSGTDTLGLSVHSTSDGIMRAGLGQVFPDGRSYGVSVVGNSTKNGNAAVYGRIEPTFSGTSGPFGILGYRDFSGRLWSGYFNNGNVYVSGNVGIGTESPTQKLDIDGNVRIRSIGSGGYSGQVNRKSDGTLTTSTSDARLKQNILEVDNALNKVLSLRGVTFNWKDPKEPRRMMGMIAQEVKDIVPELVFQDPASGYYGINYGETSALLIEALKDLKYEKDDEIEELRKQNDELKRALCEIKSDLDICD